MTRRRSFVPFRLLAMASLALGACGGEEEPAAAAPAPVVAPDPTPVVAPEPEPVPAEGETVVQARALEAGEQFADAVHAATAAIEAAAEEVDGAEPCVQAWTGIQRMVAVARTLNPRTGAEAERDLPSPDEFMRLCGELPEPVQRCLVMSYALQHEAECARHQSQLRSLQEAARGG